MDLNSSNLSEELNDPPHENIPPAPPAIIAIPTPSTAVAAERLTSLSPLNGEKKKKTMSPKQIEANRRNAQKSTGPKTPEGKAVVKKNALKHGLLARNVVLQGLHDREQAREFRQLCRRYWEHYDPVGPAEEMWVECIVITYWRRHRGVIAERGEIALHLDHGYWQRQQPSRTARQFLNEILFESTDLSLKMEETARGLAFLLDLLQHVRAAVEHDGELTGATLKLTHIADKPNLLTNRLTDLRTIPVAHADGLTETELKARRREQILIAIDNMVQDYHRQEKQAREHENAEELAHQAADILPAADKLDKILRYESALDRQLKNAIDELERLQCRRRGEKVPPPLSKEAA